MLKDFNKSLDMSSSAPVIVPIRLHEYPWVRFEIQLRKFNIVIETLSIMLEVEIGEEASVDMFT